MDAYTSVSLSTNLARWALVRVYEDTKGMKALVNAHNPQAENGICRLVYHLSHMYNVLEIVGVHFMLRLNETVGFVIGIFGSSCLMIIKK